jgi:hypothetical protein
MSSGAKEGPVRLQKVATEEVRDGAPAPFDCRPATLTRERGSRAPQCLSSGHLSDGCPCRSSFPAERAFVAIAGWRAIG